ncbi:MAG: hypothetical protein WAT71_06660 [Ignavibacteria bacterium]
MESVIISYAVVHPPQTTSTEKAAENSFYLYDADEGLVDTLRKARKESNKSQMIKLAQNYTESSKYIDSAKKADSKLMEFIDVVNSKSKNYNQFVRENFLRIFDATPSKFIASPTYKQIHKVLTESLIASAIDDTVSPKSKSLIFNLAKALQTINLLTKETAITKEKVLQIKIVLPSGIFPLPLEKTNLVADRKKEVQNKKKIVEENQKRRLQLSDELKNYNSTIEELVSLFDNSEKDEHIEVPSSSKIKRGFYLPKSGTQKLTDLAKKTIKKTGFETDQIDIVKTITNLEKKAAQTAFEISLFGDSSGYKAKNVGQNEVIIPDRDLEILETGTGSIRTPGICSPQNIKVTAESTPITTNGKHEVRVLGIADLLIVEQKLARYELGEISHIENVLKSELRDRKHRISNLTEESVTTETEETDFKENDLSSSERFELQSESQKVINESTNIEAGATISASYGFVDSTANFNYSNNNSLSETQRSASNFARETISKAVSKLEKRNLERRFRRTVKETEEINQHTFDNTKDGADNITGIYRFVNKIYNAQIVNYGKRLMLEFIVPEPAAFLRHVMTLQPTDNSIVKPEEPGYCSSYGRVFTPLRAQDIDKTSYLIWSSKYGVENITPPPAEYIIIGQSFSKDGQDLRKETESNTEHHIYWHSENAPIAINNGYLPQQGKAVVDFTYVDIANINTESTNQKLTVQLGDEQHTFMPQEYPTDLADQKKYDPNANIINHKSFVIEGKPTNSLPLTISTWGVMAFGLNITLLCKRTEEALVKWQIDTYNAIMNAYNDQLNRYYNAIESAKIRAGFTQISGTNPIANRETEKTELKRGCITLLTGQQFEGFDAMVRNVGFNGYPEIDFDVAAEEGKFISFFEQAFEWNNMTYLFYPYFWAKKDQWTMLSRLTDTDPQFAKFLQAGSCRISLPVRVSFEDTMLNYLNNNIIWSAEGGSFINSDTSNELDMMHLSLLEELKSHLNNMNTEGEGFINVTKDSNLIEGIDTSFTDDDENKRIIIGGKTYLIKNVESATTIYLKTPYLGETESSISYSFGAALYGDSWEVKLPTDLVKIDDNLNF